MAKIIVAFLFVLSLAGCATVPVPQVKYVTTECPEAPVIERPDLDTDYLTDKSNPGDVIQAHRLAIKKLQKWGMEEEAILNGYRKSK